MTTETLPETAPPPTADDELEHWYCCNPDLDLCGADIDAEPFGCEADMERPCPMCEVLLTKPSPCCGYARRA